MTNFSESPKERMTGRTIHSIDIIGGDIKNKEILNIGSLGGWLEERIYGKEDYKKVIGLDLPSKHIKTLQEQHKDDKKISFIEGSVLELPFEKNSFDIVTMFEVIEHIPKGTELFALMEINRVLRKGGKLVLSTPFDDWRAKILDPAWYFGHRHYSIKTMEYLIKESGFFDFKVEKRGGYWELITMIIFYIFKHIFRREIPFKNFFENKRKKEFQKQGFTNIYIQAKKNRDS